MICRIFSNEVPIPRSNPRDIIFSAFVRKSLFPQQLMKIKIGKDCKIPFGLKVANQPHCDCLTVK